MKVMNRSFCAETWGARMLLTGLLLSIAPVAWAEAIRTTVDLGEDLKLDELPKEAAELGLERKDDAIELELEDAIALTLRRNLALVVERYRRSQAIQGVKEAFGIFDLNLGGNLVISESSSLITTTLVETEGGSVTDESTVFNADLSQLTAWGGSANLSFRNQRTETDNQRSINNPQFVLNLDVSYTQPLLRNFGKQTTYNGVLVARNNSAISREAFRNQVEGFVQQVSEQYWRLVEALQQLKVSEESLALARELHDMNRIQVEVGTMAPLEMVQSEAGVATREEEIIRRQAAVEDSMDVLRQLLNLDRIEYWDLDIVPVTDPITDYVEIDFAKAYATALQKRTDVEQQRLTNANRELQLALARNQLKPSLDLTVGYGVNAVDGTRPGLSPAGEEILIENDYFDAVDQLLDGESNGWSVQAVFAYPLQNRSAKARLATADLDFKQGEVEMRDLEQQVLLNIRSLARAVRTAQQQIESAEVSTKLQRKNLEAERKRYENGLATSFEVLQIQEDLTEALSREVSAITNYRRALNDFYFATGEILDKVGVELVEPKGEE